MTNIIEIPTYIILIPNSTYGRKSEPVRFPMSEDRVPATQILQLLRYTIPSEEEIIDLIQSVARSYNPFSTTGKKSAPQEIQLDEFMKMFPSDEIKRIQDGRKDTLSHLRNHCPSGTYQIGRTYLQVANGVIPNEILSSANEAVKEEGAMIYEDLINRIGINGWHLRIRLDGKDRLPNNLELEYLLDRGVKDCDVFRVNGDYENYQAVANQIRLLCNVLGSSSDMRKIADSSNVFLKSRAATTLKETAACLSAREAFGSLAKGLIGIITETIDGQEKLKRDNPHGDCGFSLN